MKNKEKTKDSIKILVLNLIKIAIVPVIGCIIYEITHNDFIYNASWIIGAIVGLTILIRSSKEQRKNLIIAFIIIILLYVIGLIIYFCLFF